MSSEDRRLMARAAEGDTAAFALIATRYRSRLEQIGYKLLHCPAAGEDVAQETLKRAFQQVRKFRQAAEPLTWLHSIALRVCHGCFRSRKREICTPDPALLEKDRRRSPPDVGPLPTVLRREADRQLRRALDRLTESQRNAFVLHNLEGHPHETVARILKTTPQSARALCLRARRALRRGLARHFLSTA